MGRFRHQRQSAVTQPEGRRRWTVIGAACRRGVIPRVSLRSHLNEARQPHRLRAPPAHLGTAEPAGFVRQRPEAADVLVNPACSLTPGPFGKTDTPHRRIPTLHSPPAIAANSSLLRRPALTQLPPPVSTAASRWPSWPCSFMEPKASQSLPALQAPVSNRDSRSPGGGGPEVSFVVHVPVALPAFIAGRS